MFPTPEASVFALVAVLDNDDENEYDAKVDTDESDDEEN